MALMKLTSPSSARSRIRRRVGTVVARKRNLNLDGKGNEMNIIDVNTLPSNDDLSQCTVVLVNKSMTSGIGIIREMVSLFSVDLSKARMHVYYSGLYGKICVLRDCDLSSIIKGARFFSGKGRQEWWVRIKDDQRDILAVVPEGFVPDEGFEIVTLESE
jgi:hypothetical protein